LAPLRSLSYLVAIHVEKTIRFAVFSITPNFSTFDEDIRHVVLSKFLVLVMQSIDGFLAILNVTGGNFSPPTQKLPFTVTSIDEDSSLLYYSSIGLAGRLPPNNSKSPRLKRSLSNSDSRSAKSRLRIPVKGRIQLVLNCLTL